MVTWRSGRCHRILGGPTFLVNGREPWGTWWQIRPCLGGVRGQPRARHASVRVLRSRRHDAHSRGLGW